MIRGNLPRTTGCKIDIDDDGVIKVASVDSEAAERAVDWIKGIVAEPELGVIYKGKVVKVLEFGAFVNFLGAKGWSGPRIRAEVGAG